MGSMGKPLQASPETAVLPELVPPTAPAVAPVLPAVPAVPVLPPRPAEVAEPPLLDCVPALACELGSMVLPGGSLQAIATPTNSCAKRAIELECLRMLTSLDRRATVDNIDAPSALALDAATGVAC